MKTIIDEIEREMADLLDDLEMDKLHKVLIKALENLDVNQNNHNKNCLDEIINYCDMFIYAKKVEGCSDKSIKYYKSIIESMLKVLQKPISTITTYDLRKYLGDYHKNNNCSKVTVDNIRRIISSFFSWLEEENHILKSPARRIYKIKTEQVIKETDTDEI